MVGGCGNRRILVWTLAGILGLIAGCSTPGGGRAPVSLDACAPGGVWVVRAGDTLSEIAQRCRVSLRDLAQYNQIDPPYMIRIGQRLRIPYRVLEKRRFSKHTRPALTLHWPIRAPKRWVSDDKGHHALFFKTGVGQPVRAAASGKVEAVTQLPGYGRVVVLSHPGGYMSVYAYLLKASVKQGMRVQSGQRLGHVGLNPLTGEPGLYFELRYGKRQVDLKQWRHWAE